DALFPPAVPGFSKVPFGSIGAVAEAITPRTVAVMLEPIQGEAGVFEAGDDFLRALRALTAERGILLIVDEIQTGVGRTGRFFGYQHAGIEPDIVTVGKGIGGGGPPAGPVAPGAGRWFGVGGRGGQVDGKPPMAPPGWAAGPAAALAGVLR